MFILNLQIYARNILYVSIDTSKTPGEFITSISEKINENKKQNKEIK